MTDFIAFFPGQGAQHVGMLAELAEQHAVIKETFDEASQAIDLDLWALAQAGPAETLNLTYNTQPALLTASIALWRLLQQQTGELNVVAAAGHSLGEYSALVAAGAVDFATAVRLVKRRGELMDAAVPAGEGGMAAVLGLSEEQIDTLCQQVREQGLVEPANFNAPGQIVIAGESAGIAAAVTAAKELGAKRALPLSVSGPFHSSLMKAAAGEFEAELNAVEWRAPKFDVYHNVDNAPAPANEIAAKLLAQLYSPVNWTGAVQACRSSAELAIEFGPGKVLAGLNKRIDKSLITKNTADEALFAGALEALKETV
ncbi:[acyl-carrier-protein] S-malonyltransferase [Bacterioplanes sanyensis]|uniref:Malonyl CoA-acyl carrier protein transacylase n=1 Tax=Bacterioplanes sanyensis TaxID=1249553 RepID=A0A222FMA8_9GAMM|nr:ACP S-malonyltransferase [Bacterioplanes sanyensis]ASP39879.1 [acyl-carrier-protein] S-malonyltransferase [Bacterioplanes sanyensis]